MGIIKTDGQRLLEAVNKANNGHHREAAAIYQNMGNEVRNPKEKEALWKAAQHARKQAEE